MYQIGIDFSKILDTVSIVVDWSELAKYNYKREVTTVVPWVGERIANFAHKLNLRGDQIIAFGHSIGVHVIGTAAKVFYNSKPQTTLNDKNEKFRLAYGEFQSHFKPLLLYY